MLVMQGSAGQAYRFQRIKAISFDGDMTLWDFEAVLRHSLGRALAEPHVPTGETTYRSDNRSND
jgi:phosphoglycolate phosphatase-like HAD superfamily hydrolase